MFRLFPKSTVPIPDPVPPFPLGDRGRPFSGGINTRNWANLGAEIWLSAEFFMTCCTIETRSGCRRPDHHQGGIPGTDCLPRIAEVPGGQRPRRYAIQATGTIVAAMPMLRSDLLKSLYVECQRSDYDTETKRAPAGNFASKPRQPGRAFGIRPRPSISVDPRLNSRQRRHIRDPGSRVAANGIYRVRPARQVLVASHSVISRSSQPLYRRKGWRPRGRSLHRPPSRHRHAHGLILARAVRRVPQWHRSHSVKELTVTHAPLVARSHKGRARTS